MGPPSPEHHSVIIIGAGQNGLVAAKTYLQMYPQKDILIIDAEDGVGGVWCASRVYPGLTYEVPTPLMSFSDFSICKELVMKEWEDVTGFQLNEFLVKYAEKYNLISRCRFNTNVINIERNGLGWKIHVQPTGEPDAPLVTITCDKIISATGITSRPKIPDYDLSKFNGFAFHAKEMGKRHQELVTDEVGHVTIIGGHKSALEAVGTVAQAGKKVEWIIKEDGGGPTWMMPAKNPDGSSLAKMTTVKFLTFFTTSPYNSDRWLDRFLHSGRYWLCTKLIAKFWSFMTKNIQGDKYTKSENGKKLKPTPNSMFWFVPGGTIMHDRDLETLRLVDEEKLIHVSRSHLTSVSDNTVTLHSGEQIPTDALVICTGWEITSTPMFSPALALSLGIPADPSVISASESGYWRNLDAYYEKYFGELYPVLTKPPPEIHIADTGLTPFRLYRFLVPSSNTTPSSQNIVFLGNYANGRVQLTAELSSLWSVAYLENLFPASTTSTLSNKQEMDKDISRIEVYRRMRYLSCIPYRLSLFETGEFDDVLMEDLGLRADRKKLSMERNGEWGWWGLRAWKRKWFDGWFADDYEGIVEEFLEGLRSRGGVLDGVEGEGDESTSLIRKTI